MGKCAYGMLELLSWGSLPLQMAVALGLLYMQVKFAFLAGLAVIILLIPGGWVCSPSLSAGQSVSSDGFWISEVFLHEGRSWSVSWMRTATTTVLIIFLFCDWFLWHDNQVRSDHFFFVWISQKLLQFLAVNRVIALKISASSDLMMKEKDERWFSVSNCKSMHWYPHPRFLFSPDWSDETGCWHWWYPFRRFRVLLSATIFFFCPSLCSVLNPACSFFSITWTCSFLFFFGFNLMNCMGCRVRKMGELLVYMRTIKMYAWEHFFVGRILQSRNQELKQLSVCKPCCHLTNLSFLQVKTIMDLLHNVRFFLSVRKKLLVLYYKQQRNKWCPFFFVWKCEQIRKYLDAFCVYFWACTPALFSLCTFGLFVLTGHTLDAATVTTSSLSQNVVLWSWSCVWVISSLKVKNSPLWKFSRERECDVKLWP